MIILPLIQLNETATETFTAIDIASQTGQPVASATLHKIALMLIAAQTGQPYCAVDLIQVVNTQISAQTEQPTCSATTITDDTPVIVDFEIATQTGQPNAVIAVQAVCLLSISSHIEQPTCTMSIATDNTVDLSITSQTSQPRTIITLQKILTVSISSQAGQPVTSITIGDALPVTPICRKIFVHFISRIIKAGGSKMVETKYKDPDATLDYSVDWSEWLSGDTIVSSEWFAEPGITIVRASNTTQIATVWLSNGSNRAFYIVTNRITTAAGRIDERSIKISVLNM